MTKPKLHMFRGRWYCCGDGVGAGRTPELAYCAWMAAHVRAEKAYRAALSTGVHYTNRGREYGYAH